MPDNHKNFAKSTLATPPNGTSGTSLVVATGDGALFPDAPFNVTVWPAGAGIQPTASNAEVMRVTAKVTDTFTVTRAQEGTSARSFSNNAQIAATITARTLTDAEYGAHGIINVMDPRFGAVGDGVTDDGTAINAAITALPDTGGDILFPPGDYLTSTTITITKPGVRLIGSNGGSWRAGAFSQVPALTTRSTTNIIGTTASMTVVQCNGVGNLGVTTEQAGPVIMNLSIWDNAGRIAGEPGTMTLLHLRDVNRWTVQNVGLYWGSVGAKLQKNTAGDCAGWVVNQAFVMGCATGGIIDTFSGHWQNGWISLCGTALDCDLTEGSRPSSIRISDIKFDILDPSENATYAPGVGIEIGEVETVQVARCVFENQPGSLAAPTTTAILINPGDSQTTRVELNDCVTVEHAFGVDCEKALFLKVNGHIHRTRSGSVGGTAAIRITSCVRATIAQSLSAEASDIPIQLGALASDVTITDTDAVVELV